MRWSVRRAVEADADRIGAITVAGWRHAYRGIVADDRLDALHPTVFAEARRRAIAAPEPTAIFVAEDDGGTGVRGYCTVGPPRVPDRSGDTTLPTAELHSLYVEPPVIGTGAGGALHDAGVAHLAACGFRRAVLWVYTANTGAQEFYARRGWHADGQPHRPPEWSAPATLWARRL